MKMTAQSTVYDSNGFIEPASAEDHFSQNFDLQNPDGAMTEYQKLMHEHTKQQFELATASSSRRSTMASTDSTAPLTTESSVDSTSSTAS